MEHVWAIVHATYALSARLAPLQAARERSLVMMDSYLRRVGLWEAVRALPVIHLAGTKGKGSSAAMTESILRHAGLRTGLYTSPHLVSLTERFRFDGEAVEEARLVRHALAIWRRLCATLPSSEPTRRGRLAAPAGGGSAARTARPEDCATSELAADAASESEPPWAEADAPATVVAALVDPTALPSFFPFLTLVAFSLFIEARVDVLVLETGLGGRLDSTNVVPRPVVCGITTLDFDHMALLGDTLPAIASEKAGIFKPGVPAFTVPQRADALAQLARIAAIRRTPLRVVHPARLERWGVRVQGSDGAHGHRAPGGEGSAASAGRATSDASEEEAENGVTELGLAGEFQLTNAALAVALSDEFLRRRMMRQTATAQDETLSDALSEPVSTEEDAGAPSPPSASSSSSSAAASSSSSSAASSAAPSSDAPASVAGARRRLLPAMFREGLACVRWSGRAQLLRWTPGAEPPEDVAAAGGGRRDVAGPPPTPATASILLFLDGAHTERSMQMCVQWFATTAASLEPASLSSSSSTSSSSSSSSSSSLSSSFTSLARETPTRSVVPRPPRVLLFNCGQEKDALQLLLPLTTLAWDAVVLCPFDVERPHAKAPTPSTRALLRAFVERKRLMNDAQSLRDLGLDETRPTHSPETASGATGGGEGASDEDTSAEERMLADVSDEEEGGRGERASRAPSSMTTSMPTTTTTTTTAAWQHTLAHAWTRLHTLSVFQHLRRRLARPPVSYDAREPAETLALPPGVEGDLPTSTPTPVVTSSIAEALRWIAAFGAERPGTQVLITGSLYLLGGVLNQLRVRA